MLLLSSSSIFVQRSGFPFLLSIRGWWVQNQSSIPSLQETGLLTLLTSTPHLPWSCSNTSGTRWYKPSPFSLPSLFDNHKLRCGPKAVSAFSISSLLFYTGVSISYPLECLFLAFIFWWSKNTNKALNTDTFHNQISKIHFCNITSEFNHKSKLFWNCKAHNESYMFSKILTLIQNFYDLHHWFLPFNDIFFFFFRFWVWTFIAYLVVILSINTICQDNCY